MPDYQAKFPPRLLSAWENHCLGRNIHILLEPVYQGLTTSDFDFEG